MKELVGGRRLRPGVLDQIDIQAPIIVVVEESGARSDRFGHEELSHRADLVLKLQPGALGNIFQPRLRFGGFPVAGRFMPATAGYEQCNNDAIGENTSEVTDECPEFCYQRVSTNPIFLRNYGSIIKVTRGAKADLASFQIGKLNHGPLSPILLTDLRELNHSICKPNRGFFRSRFAQPLAMLGLAVLIFAGAGNASAAKARTAKDLSGTAIDPLTHMTNKAVVFIFVSSECPISNRYVPEIRRLHEKFRVDGIKFWLVYPNSDDSPAAIRQHTNDYKFACAPLRDPAHVLVKAAKATVTPEAAVFLPGGRLAYHGRIDNRNVTFGKERPEATQHDLQDVLEAIASGKQPTGLSTRAVGCYIATP